MGRTEVLTHVGDADLAERAAAGDTTAFGELYRRHAPMAWRVAYTVTSNREDAADAVSDAFTRVLQALPAGRLRDGGSFRAYLLTTTRRAGIDTARKRNRPLRADAITPANPTEHLLDAADSALVAAAFRGLPERWRSVLWLTEVEQIPAKEAAPLLGLSPNGVAQLAVRARNGLRERYLQAHVGVGHVPAACRPTVDRLGAYVAGALAPRDLAKVDQHLAGCEPCRARHAELEEMGEGLRRIMVPLPLGLGALALKQWRFQGGLSAAGRLRKTAALAGRAERPLAVMSATLFAAGLAGLGLVGKTPPAPAAEGPVPRVRGADRVLSAATPPRVLSWPTSGNLRGDTIPAESPAAEARLRTRSGTVPAGVGPGDLWTDVFDVVSPADHTAPPTTPPTTTPQPPAKPAAQVQVTVSGGGQRATAAAGHGANSCTGGAVGGQAAG
ncbi:MAG TPA: sigma-70 family RNA polymerase sigma factor, partial [Acidimicrobiales bacterium]|nr:sigma-70 family RNA polymerase sigma factor [Acidimicrobiales bacterium]